MKAFGEVELQTHFILTSALAGGEWSASHPGDFTPRVRAPGTHWIAGCVGLRDNLGEAQKRKFLILPGLELRPHGRPAVASRHIDCTIPAPMYMMMMMMMMTTKTIIIIIIITTTINNSVSAIKPTIMR
jgi:hypothetical protein